MSIMQTLWCLAILHPLPSSHPLHLELLPPQLSPTLMPSTQMQLQVFPSAAGLHQAFFLINLGIPGLHQSHLSPWDSNQLAGPTISSGRFSQATSPFLLLLLLVLNILRTVLSTLMVVSTAKSTLILSNMTSPDMRPLSLPALSWMVVPMEA